MVKEGTPNPNVNIKGYPKNFWGCLVRKLTIHNKSHYFNPPKGGLSLTLTRKGQTYNPKCKPKQYPNKTLRFSWDGHMHSMHNTAKCSDWLVFQNRGFSLVTILTSISQSLYDFSQPDFHHTYPSHI